MRVGQSTDIHQLVEGRPLILGGVHIEHPVGCLGHSDGDVLLHAIAEAILGACGLRDLGTHFPDTDMQYKDASSMVLLSTVFSIIQLHGFSINNIDSLIILEKPKLAPYIDAMTNNIANVLHIDPSRVNVKATTSENMGFVGRREGIMAQAIVSVKEIET